MAEESNLVVFKVINPEGVANEELLEAVTVKTIMALLQVPLSDDDIAKLPGRELARFINGNIARLEHTKGGMNGLKRQHPTRFTYDFSYCSLCGSSLDNAGCTRCKIKFPSNQVSAMLASKNGPYLPARVVDCIQKTPPRHRFFTPPPR